MARFLLVGGLASSLVRFRGPLIDAALAAGHEVTCAAGEPDAETEAALRRRGVAFHAIELERTGTSLWSDISAIIALVRLIRRVRPDVVLGYTVKPALYSVLASRLTGIGRPFAMLTGLGYALTPTDGPSTRVARLAHWLARQILPRAERVFFHNADDRRFCERFGLIRAEQGVVVDGSGVDLESFPAAPLPDGPTTFLLVARLLRDKGIEDFVAAARIVHRRFPDTRFRVVGDRDATSRSVTAAEIEDWQHSTPVDFVGPVSKPWSEFAASHVFVLPSTYREGLPRTLLEAMAVGRAIITTDMPGCRDAVVDDNGILIAPRSVDALVAAMSRLVAHPELVVDMGARGRALAVSRFDGRIVAAMMLRSMSLTESAAACTSGRTMTHTTALPFPIDSRPRVLHIITGLGTGGAEASLVRVLAATRGDVAHTVVSLTSKGTRGRAIEALGISVFALGLARGAIAPRAIGALRRIVRDVRPTRVQGWMYHGNIAASLLSMSGAATGPVIWNVRHALDAWQRESRTLRALIRVGALFSRQPRSIVYNSERAAAQHEALGFRVASTQIIPNGVDIERFKPHRAAGTRVRDALGIPPSGFVVGMIARVDPLKDHDTFLAAIASYEQMRVASGTDHAPTIWYLLAGTETGAGTPERPGALDTRIAALVAACPSLVSRIIQLGERSDIPDVVNACDVVTLSSRSEGSPNAVAEAMACGIPCVVTNVGDAALLVGDSGVVVPVGDHHAIAEVWHGLQLDAADRRSRGERALARVTARYTNGIEASAYLRLWGARGQTPRVLMITTLSRTLQAFLLPFADHYRARGWRVDAAAADVSGDATSTRHFDHTYDISWARNPFRLRNLAALRRVRALVQRGDYDLVHVHTPVAAFVTRLALRKLARPVVVYTAHSFHADRTERFWKNAVFRTLERLAGRWTDHLIVINEADAQIAQRDRLVPAHRLHRHPGIGVNVEQFGAIGESRRRAVRDALGIADAETMLIVVAEFNRNKRQIDVLHALARLERRTTRRPVVLFAGDGPTRAVLERRAQQLGVGDRVRFLGHRRDIAELTGASDGLILCSSREGLPRCVLEAQALGVPVIGTDAKGTRDLLQDDRGFLVPIGDVDALASAIMDLRAKPAEGRRRAERAAAWVRTQCNLEVVMSLHDTLYASALGLPHTSGPNRHASDESAPSVNTAA